MDHPVQGKPLYVVLLLRKYLYVCPIGAPSSYFPFLLSPNLDHKSYTHARLLEINAHSLFSKWFSESGKLVQRLFHNITELVEEEDSFVVVLIGIYLFSRIHIAYSSHE
jgi:hypothetical protein